VEVLTKDGRTLRADIPLALGNPGNPMSWTGMERKFAGLVEPVLGEKAQWLFENLRRFEQPGTLAKVMALVASR
jgi:2-methylcitrate dehydratase PrpD